MCSLLCGDLMATLVLRMALGETKSQAPLAQLSATEQPSADAEEDSENVQHSKRMRTDGGQGQQSSSDGEPTPGAGACCCAHQR